MQLEELFPFQSNAMKTQLHPCACKCWALTSQAEGLLLNFIWRCTNEPTNSIIPKGSLRSREVTLSNMQSRRNWKSSVMWFAVNYPHTFRANTITALAVLQLPFLTQTMELHPGHFPAPAFDGDVLHSTEALEMSQGTADFSWCVIHRVIFSNSPG